MGFCKSPLTPHLQRRVQAYLLHLSQPPCPSAARTLLAALTFVSDSQPCLHPFPRSYWHIPTALQRVAPPPRRSWFSLLRLSAADSSFRPADAPLYGMVLISFVFLLGISEAAALTSADLLDSQLAIRPAKRLLA